MLDQYKVCMAALVNIDLIAFEHEAMEFKNFDSFRGHYFRLESWFGDSDQFATTKGVLS